MTWLNWIFVTVAGLIAHQILGWYYTKRISALNVVHAALTYRTFSAGQAGSVDGQVANICYRMGIDIARLGDSFPANENPSGVGGPAVVYAFRSLAMYELDIPPVDSDLREWHVLRNPFNAAFAVSQVQKFRKKYELKYDISLVELDLS